MLEGTKKKVLLVDDDKDLLDATAILITRYGFDVVTAENGKLAVEAFKKNNPDLILMDAKMPVMDGYEAFFKIREISKEARVILMTGFGADERLAEAKAHCLIYLLVKPVKPEFLKELINRHIEAHTPC